jgi:anaerobic magnesium-protoporphyrin IX monomethyl ester cyclase
MRVVLVLPGSGFRNSSPTSLAGGEHLGLGSIAAYLRQFGHEVHILNFQVEDSLFRSPRTSQEVSERILAFDPEIVGMSITGLTISQALEVSAQIKRRSPGLHVCWGSHQAASCAADILENEHSVDTIVAGDGEIPMQKLLEALETGKPLSTVPGLWYRDFSAPENSLPGMRLMQIKLSSSPPEPDINALPFPARDTLEDLLRRDVKISDARIYTSRGCPFRCTFCVYPALSYLKKWRDRTANSIVEEIRMLSTEYGITHFWFSDDNFTLPTVRGRLRALELAESLIEAKLGITYRVLMRADAVDGQDKLIDALARSGLTCVYMGIESGSPRRLKYLDKHTNPDVYRRAIKLVRAHRVGLQVGFIMFDPLTSWDDLEIDAAFLHDTEEAYLYTNYSQILYAYPGTPVAKQLIDKGLLPPTFNYRSGYCEYGYEDPSIGRLADIMHKANDKSWVDVDDFFRRLRMIDVPGLFRLAPGKAAEDINYEVESKILDLNQKGFALLNGLLEAGRAVASEEQILRLIDSHYRYSLAKLQQLTGTFRLFPEEITRHVSALKYFDTGSPSDTRRKGSALEPAPPITQMAASAVAAGDCA